MGILGKLFAVGIVIAAIGACSGSEDEPAYTPVGTFKIGAIADCQYADSDDNGERKYRGSPAKLKEAVGVLNEFDLEFVLHLGDFIDRDWESYEPLKKITATLEHPLHHVLGNHEYSVVDERKPLVHSHLGMPARYHSFTHGQWVFVVTDGNDLSYHGWQTGSERYRKSVRYHQEFHKDKFVWNGALDDEQLQWLEEILARADKTGQRAIVLSHFPIAPDHGLNLWNANEVVALLERHPSVKAYINGHNHDGAYTERNGIHYITLKAMLDTDRNSFSIIEFANDKITVSGFGRQGDMELAIN